MIVLSHRGYWKTPEEKNTRCAFERSFDLGFGTETDVRDCAGELVISHDMPRGGEMTLREFLNLVGNRDLPLALNIKADGLADVVQKELQDRNLSQWFLFDMSIPDLVQQLKRGNPVFGRISELEPQLLFVDQVKGVWLDAFYSDWWNPSLIEDWTVRGKTVCIVSPELHRRDPLPVWTELRRTTFTHPERVWLCTDRPEEAQTWFKEML